MIASTDHPKVLISALTGNVESWSAAETVRVGVEDQNGGQIGTANLDRSTSRVVPD